MTQSSLFKVHKLTEDGLAKAAFIAESFDSLVDALATVCPQSTREFSIVKTKLEEAAFFAKKSMAAEPANQQK